MVCHDQGAPAMAWLPWAALAKHRGDASAGEAAPASFDLRYKLNGSVFGKRCVVCNRNSIKNSKLVEIWLNMTICMISHLLLYISLHSPNFIREALKPRPSLIHRPSQHSSAEAKSSVGDTIRQSCSLGQQVNPALNSLWLRPWLRRWRKKHGNITKKARNDGGMMEWSKTCVLDMHSGYPETGNTAHLSKWISHEKNKRFPCACHFDGRKSPCKPVTAQRLRIARSTEAVLHLYTAAIGTTQVLQCMHLVVTGSDAMICVTWHCKGKMQPISQTNFRRSVL